MHELNLTTVHVTHNQAEALEMGDRIAVMDAGHVVQVGDPETIYHRPIDEHVARFVGDMNLIPGAIERTDDTFAYVQTPVGTFHAMKAADMGFNEGQRCYLGIRPADVVVPAPPDADPATCLTANVTDRRFQGDRMVYGLSAGDITLDAATHHSALIGIGTTVNVQLPPDSAIAVHLSPSKGDDGS